MYSLRLTGKLTRRERQFQVLRTQMADVVDQATRSKMMSGIRGKNTKPELIIRSGLHRRGFRFRLHDKSLPGKPDLVFRQYKAIILIHGCFWHGHDCHLFKWPSTRPEFWKEKIQGNRERDERHNAEYARNGWRVLTIWECALKGKFRLDQDEVLGRAALWLRSATSSQTICGLDSPGDTQVELADRQVAEPNSSYSSSSIESSSSSGK